MVSIKSYLNTDLIDRISALSVGEQRPGQAVAAALKGEGSSINKISRSVNFAAQAYAKSLTSINFVGSAINLAESDLTQLQKITERAIALVEEVKAPNTPRRKRDEVTAELYQMGKSYYQTLEAAELGEKKYLTKPGLEELFVQVGLDPEKSRQIGNAFDKLTDKGSDHYLADPGINGAEETGEGQEVTQASGKLFTLERRIRTKDDAKSMLNDLTALHEQISTNIDAIGELRGHLIENAELVRASAIAFGEISGDLGGIEDAEGLVQVLQREITKRASHALSHAENLEPLIVAALTSGDNNLLN